VLEEGPRAFYYYGNHATLAVPCRTAMLEFPFNLIQVRPCMRLRGELEVIAKYFVPRGTCFLYCGPRLRRRDETNITAMSTAMNIDRRGRRIQGGNIMKFVNHRFGFADEGNVAFRRGAIMYRPSQRVTVDETHINFFVATKDIAAGELLLAEGYGPEYDSFIERLAFCGGRYLSAEERQALEDDEVNGGRLSNDKKRRDLQEDAPTVMTPGAYLACYVSDIHVGSIVGRRVTNILNHRDAFTSTSALQHQQKKEKSSFSVDESLIFYRVTTITEDNVILGEELKSKFPMLYDRDPEEIGTVVPRVAVLRKTEAILFIPGWDYEDVVLRPSRKGSTAEDASPPVGGSTANGSGGWCARLKMPKEALERATYADIIREMPL
jgi:hypothetical protein